MVEQHIYLEESVDNPPKKKGWYFCMVKNKINGESFGTRIYYGAQFDADYPFIVISWLNKMLRTDYDRDLVSGMLGYGKTEK